MLAAVIKMTTDHHDLILERRIGDCLDVCRCNHVFTYPQFLASGLNVHVRSH